MHQVTIEPAEFHYVFFDADGLADLTRSLAAEVGIPTDVPIKIVVDETTPLGHSELTAIDPVTIAAESGAFEDPRRLRHFSPSAATDVIGRHLFRAKDRLDSDFGEPPADPDLDQAQRTAWDLYAIGRLHRLGHAAQRQRRLYQFRTRHGFTDVADRVFETIWESDDLSWSDLMKLSEEAQAANPGRLSA